MKRPFLVLLIAASCAAQAATPVPSEEQLATLLNTAAQGRDASFGNAVAPAQSLNTGASGAVRVAEVDLRIAREMARVVAAFREAPAAEKIAATRAAVARDSEETARDGASRAFEGTGPSLSVMRQLLFVPAAGLGEDPVGRIMATVGSFERSPKTDDTYYQYSDPRDLKKSAIIDLPGSDASWTTRAQPPMTPDVTYGLKKCRAILVLGWYCNTSLYVVRTLGAAGGATALLTMLRPLPPGADNAKFSGGRAENIVDGYTAAYVVAAAGDLVLVYNLGIQNKADEPSQQRRLNEGHKAEYRQLVSRIEADFGIRKLPF